MAQEIDLATQKITGQKIDSLLTIAATAIENNDYNTSAQIMTRARILAEKTNNKGRIGLASSALSRLYLLTGNIEKAKEENNLAIKMQEGSEDHQENNLGQSYITAAKIELLQRNYPKASEYLEKAEETLESLGRPELLSKVYLNQGTIALIKNNPQKAGELFDLAIKKAEKTDDGGGKFLIAKSNIQKAEVLLLQKKIDEASNTIKITQDISISENYPTLLSESYRVSSRIAKEQNDIAKAYEHIMLYNTYTDQNRKNKEEEIVIQQFKEDKVLSAQLKEEIEIERARARDTNRLTTVLTIAMITILSLLILSLYKNNNLRTKANELLQAKNTELIVAKDNAEKASMVKAQFLSTITHELRTPMYAVTGLTHLLLSENPTPEQKKHLDSLKFSGEYLLSLINNILDLNKLEANKVEVEQTAFNLKKRIEDVLFALGKSAKDKGNKLNFEFDQDIPEEVLGDPLMISQILINLVGNAVKFTRDGTVDVRVQKIKQTDSETYLHFEVEDSGEGISKKKQKNIFQNFTQGSVAINRKFGGTGLGLSIVKNLLDLLGSKVELESTLGKGSKFSFDIKYNLTKQAAGEEANPHNIIYDIDYVALENRTILVVEDNKINQMITRKILEKNKMLCDVADNGEIAVEKARNQNFDLILMDIHMPGISGIEATEQIRLFDKEIPILALTAVTIDENIDEFHEAGFNDIIPKPYKVEEFFQKIHNGLKQAKVFN
ncbi:response regulator [uncultured Dokdonia sp.]|uniref:tetratricopeptide repeat-containing hybrid sensor histidine kinase/response regulator n=1 Tax=uncultured Dokdonia sp. TaxID=575653 RepID=UPI00260EAAF3|nr:response regulator [uncultured Dokdonia sp.]